MAVVVSDTSPLRALAALGRLDLLQLLFNEVLIPPAVNAELLQPGKRFAPVDLGGFSYIHMRAPTDVARVQTLCHNLDLGESEAIALALEINAEAILMDEASGRAIAEQLHLVPIGVLGILLRAKARSHVDAVKPLMDRLQREFGFHVGTELRAEVLRRANESE